MEDVPLRTLLARGVRGSTPFMDLARRLRCRRCGERTPKVLLVENPKHHAHGYALGGDTRPDPPVRLV